MRSQEGPYGMDNDTIAGNIFFTTTIAWRGKSVETSTIAERLTPDPTAAELFENSYKVAEDTVFNEFYRGGTGVQHIGAEIRDLPNIGRCRIDVVQRCYPIGVNIMSIHFKPLSQFAAGGVTGALIQAIAWFFNVFLYGNHAIDPLWRFGFTRARDKAEAMATKRHHTETFTRFAYVSLCNLHPDLYANHRKLLARQIYSLLFSHAKGVSTDVARQHLNQNKWSTTDFFTNYFQPGGIVSVSKAYPNPEYRDHSDYFLASGLNVLPSDKKRLPQSMRRSYDRLPEYPPVRYLALMTGVFGAAYEEVLRDSYEKLVDLRKVRVWNLLRFLRMPNQLNRISVDWALVDSFEHLNLPVTRGPVKAMLEAKHQHNIAASINTLNGANLNNLVLLLTLVASMLGLAQVVLALLPCLGFCK
jgi:hypothetical protein